jgi:hypothetical protein
MVVFIGFLIFIAVILTRLTYKVNSQAHKIQRINLEKEELIIEIALLKAKLNGQEVKTTEGQAQKAGRVYSD